MPAQDGSTVALDPDALEAAARARWEAEHEGYGRPWDNLLEFVRDDQRRFMAAAFEAIGLREERRERGPSVHGPAYVSDDIQPTAVRLVSKWRPAPTREEG